MRIVRPGDTYRDYFTTVTASGSANADTTPTATLYHNGAADGTVAVTIANPATGVYTLAASVPNTYAAGDTVSFLVTATILGLPYSGFTPVVTLSAGDNAPGSVGLSDGGVVVPAEAAGRPTGLLGMIRRLFERSDGGNKRVRDRSASPYTCRLRNANDSGDLETYQQSSGASTDTQTQGG